MTVNEIINNMREEGTTTRASLSQEKKVMNAMINDKNFSVVINRYGRDEEISPYKEYKNIVESILRHGANVSQEEAASLSENYSPKMSESSNLLNIGKCFLHTYGTSTIHGDCNKGPKINLGKIINDNDPTMNSNISLQFRRVDESTRMYPVATKSANGTTVYDRQSTTIPSHVVLHTSSPCPKK